MASNPYLLVADGKASEVVDLLSQNPSIASSQDVHGYSLVHAAASYNEFELLRKLVEEYNVDVNIRDEDGDTPLFSVETIDAAKVLVEGLGADVLAKGTEGRTAAQSIEEDGDYPEIASYLRGIEEQLKEVGNANTNGSTSANMAAAERAQAAPAPEASVAVPPVPDGLQVRVGTMDESETAGIEIDPEFRARIEELASCEDFDTPEGQARLRQLVQDAVAQQDFGEDRNVRPRAAE
ncbi:uncharacterized protein MKZ38_000260 [Zalerion maritima]|uniref:Ankyrin repeat protein n=1 Tax=Zalerion maritima TaxID=339359 RepID=A0AAD5RRT9_9PEZI|nr:uncharacterized protein MKZ38_000260 [Zalerion maritima]